MDLGSILIIIALLILVGLFVSRPFFEHRPQPTRSEQAKDHELSGLLAEQERVVNALQELDFDYSLGKIPVEDYPAQRAQLLHKGVEVLKQLDELKPGEAESSGDIEARIEAAIASRRAAAAAQAVPASVSVVTGAEAAAVPDDQLEVMLASRRRLRQEKSGGFCPQCGGAVQKSDRFCPKCGRALE